MQPSLVAQLSGALRRLRRGRTAPVYPPLEEITRVDVRVGLPGGAAPAGSITDPDRIARLVGFMNARLGGWERPWQSIPAPLLIARLYRDAALVAEVGSGLGFLELRRAGDIARQPATDADVETLETLLGCTVIHVPPKQV